MNENTQYSARRYDIDWLRVLAFILLIFYHIGMFYVADWHWHVKSDYLGEWLQYPMLLVNQWRMPLIFLISGVALRLAEPKFGRLRLLKVRFLRIFIPLLIGIYLIVPIQLYYEATQNAGMNMGYLAFLLKYINPATTLLPPYHYSPLGLFTWNHLWYLAYLWHYTLVYVLIKPVLHRVADYFDSSARLALLLLILPVLLLTVYGVILKPLYPRTNALIDDWYSHALYFTVFVWGYLCARNAHLWRMITQFKSVWIGLAVVGYLGFLILDKTTLVGTNGFATSVLIQAWLSLNKWVWLLAILGFAAVFLNQSNRVLSYMNEAILPWYILHQSVTILVAMQLHPWQLGAGIESAGVIVGTFVGCAIGYELIRRWSVTRFMFGLKLRTKGELNSALT